MHRKIHGNRIRSFSSRILKWYDYAGRTFPWRIPEEPLFRLVVTEILLQRTRAQTIAQYYSAFFQRYPDWHAIASTTVSEIESDLKPIGMWKQRAPRLKALAMAVVKRGTLPSSMSELLALPAVGQYVANATLLFQGVSALPLLDTGMARVLERYFGRRTLVDIRYDPYLQELAKSVVAVDNPRKSNWAILDLAALICRSKSPQCNMCPVRSRCLYRLKKQL